MVIPFSLTVVGQKCIRPSIIEAARNGKYCIATYVINFRQIPFHNCILVTIIRLAIKPCPLGGGGGGLI